MLKKWNKQKRERKLKCLLLERSKIPSYMGIKEQRHRLLQHLILHTCNQSRIFIQHFPILIFISISLSRSSKYYFNGRPKHTLCGISKSCLNNME